MIDVLLDLLEDGEWHTLEEVQDCLGCSARKAQAVLSFLSSFDLVELDEAGRARMEARMRTAWRKLKGLGDT